MHDLCHRSKLNERVCNKSLQWLPNSVCTEDSRKVITIDRIRKSMLLMPELFIKTFQVRWGDMDFNAHMKNTAYLDLAADVRMMYFQAHGFTMREFEQLRLGPIIMRDELEYFRELRLLEPVRVTLALAASAMMPQDSVSLMNFSEKMKSWWQE